ncbi:hypothetical protein E8E15_000107 [Penicillium rubens]|uniref:Uncharacterized protein n=1 Tax=Penicillium chrysogenum TaxID=5076 RepID=A0A167W935_PENCH|nr:uncharacterized protein N7525_005227 [Penicillium rubens]KAF3005319.1 hypothetical protein E8E15_000107 [Penicillium rubens]KAJ5044084.1 hypothetical protein NUH16_000881 [Penicillium rubens]KAJ5840039.1 hypothetical protein N7525_005227 [Penicillium rubens]KZN91398.1 hypothetical protein EN45_015320 [Penicillium chrysogenum]
MASLGLAYLDSSDTDPISDCEIVPESPPALLSTNPTIPALLSTNPTVPALPSINPTEPRMPLPPANKQYNDPELALEEINDLIKDSGYTVTSRRTKITKRGVKKTVRICYDRGRTNPHDNDDDPDSEVS